MGNSPTSTTTSTDDEDDDPSIHPEQGTIGHTAEESVDDESDKQTGGATAGASPTIPKGPDEEVDNNENEDVDRSEGQSSDQDPAVESEDEVEQDDDLEEEDEEQEVILFVHTDPWDTVGWANEPELRKLEALYPESLTVVYKPLPTRSVSEIDRDHDMPVMADLELPADTETSSRALRAAGEQHRHRSLLRRLRIAALSEGRDIEQEEVVLELAQEVGLDVDQLQEDMAELPERDEAPPRIEGQVGREPHRWIGKVEARRLQVRFAGEGVEPDSSSPGLETLVRRNEPITTTELRTVYDDPPTGSDAVKQMTLGGDEYWVAQR